MSKPTPEKIDHILPKNREFEGGDSPALTPESYPFKRRKTGGDNTAVNNGILNNLSESLSEYSSSNSSLWQETIEKVVKAIVSIRFSQVAAFDTEG